MLFKVWHIASTFSSFASGRIPCARLNICLPNASISVATSRVFCATISGVASESISGGRFPCKPTSKLLRTSESYLEESNE